MLLSADQFIERLNQEIERTKKPFIENMKNLRVESLSFREWVNIYTKWQEWIDEEGNKNYNVE